MSFKLHNITLSNIRSHESSQFVPKDEGITALKGATGSGKSTFVDSLAWTLYGTKPAGVSKTSEMIKSGSKFSQNSVFSEVTLTVDGRTFNVKRKMVSKGGAVECDVYEKSDSGDFEHRAGPAVSHAQKYIRKNFKMDEKGFLAAVLVQQKQVDQLVSAPPQERAEVIERLTGISSITKALEKSKQEVNSLKKAIQYSTVDEKTLDELKSEKETLGESINKEEAIQSSLKNKLDKAQSKLDDDKFSLEENEKALAKKEKIEYKISILEPSILTLSDDTEALEKDFTELKNSLQTIESVGSYSTIKEKISHEKENLNNLSNEKYSAENRLQESLKRLEFLSETLESAPDDDLEACKEKLDRIVNEEKTKRDLGEILKAEIRNRLQAKKAIDEGEGKCPTCLQTVEDKDETLKTFANEVRERKEKIDSCKKEIQSLKIAQTELEDTIKILAENQKMIDEVDELKNLIPVLKKNSTTINRKYSAQEKTVEALQSVFEKAQKGEELKNQKDLVSKKLSEGLAKLKKDRDSLSRLRDEIKNISSINSASIERKRSSVDALQNKISKSREKANSIEVKLAGLYERNNTIDEKILAEEKNLRNYQRMLETLEKESSAYEVISEFRSDRISNSVPAIESSASNLLSKFTEGRFIRVKLDSKFRVKVLASNGSEYSVGALSGGELSAVALSIRLAISILLAGGGTSGLIVLDEVLVSQDQTRAELILSTIKEIFHGQVIIIAHNESVDAVVDKTILL